MMCFSQRNKLIASGPIAMGLALITFAMDNYLQDFLGVVRALQVVATVSLYFGIFKKDPQHKDKFLLFWLGLTTILFGVFCYYDMDYLTESVFSPYYDSLENFLMFLLFLLLVAATALLGYLMYCVYQEFAELRNTNSVSPTTPTANDSNGFVDTKDSPPSYLSTNNLTVSIQN